MHTDSLNHPGVTPGTPPEADLSADLYSGETTSPQVSAEERELEAPVRVALVDDQALLRAGFAMIINSQPDMRVVAQGENGREAVEIARRNNVDVMLMDVRMPVLDGLNATTQILSALPASSQLKVLVLTTFDTDDYALSALRAGASGFLLKDAPPEVLLDSIRTIARGGAVIAPSTTRRLLDSKLIGFEPEHMTPEVSPETQAKLNSLTAREVEVLTALASGQSNSEIAQSLFMAEPTVKTHVGRILSKLQVRDRIHAVIFAYDAGLVHPGD